MGIRAFVLWLQHTRTPGGEKGERCKFMKKSPAFSEKKGRDGRMCAGGSAKRRKERKLNRKGRSPAETCPFGTPGATRTHYIPLRRRTLYPGEVQGRVGTVHYSAKAAARQGNYRAAPGGLPDVFDRIPPPMEPGKGGNIREGRAALCKWNRERRGGQTLTGRALRRGRSGGRSDAGGPGFAEGAERGQVRR